MLPIVFYELIDVNDEYNTHCYENLDESNLCQRVNGALNVLKIFNFKLRIFKLLRDSKLINVFWKTLIDNFIDSLLKNVFL